MGNELIWLSAALALALAGLLVIAIWTRRLAQRLGELKAEIADLNTNFSALCAGSAGVDRRLLQVERQGVEMEQRQLSLSQQQPTTEQPYGEAIQRVHQGADAAQLVVEFGLSQSEAELVVMLHAAPSAL